MSYQNKEKTSCQTIIDLIYAERERRAACIRSIKDLEADYVAAVEEAWHKQYPKRKNFSWAEVEQASVDSIQPPFVARIEAMIDANGVAEQAYKAELTRLVERISTNTIAYTPLVGKSRIGLLWT